MTGKHLLVFAACAALAACRGEPSGSPESEEFESMSNELSPVSCTTPTPTTICSAENTATPACFVALDQTRLRKEVAQFFRIPTAGTPGHIRMYLKRVVDPPQTSVPCSADTGCPGYDSNDPMKTWCVAGRCNSNPDMVVRICEAIGTTAAPKVDLSCESIADARVHARQLVLGQDALVDVTFSYAGGYTMDPAKVYVAIFKAESPWELPNDWLVVYGVGCDADGAYSGADKRALTRQMRKISTNCPTSTDACFSRPAFSPDKRNIAFALTMGDGALRCTSDADCGAGGTCNSQTMRCQSCGGTGTINLQTDPLNCGTCGHVCTTTNAKPLCEAGQCTFGACFAGFFDLDDTSAGCETQCNSQVNAVTQRVTWICENTLTHTTKELSVAPGPIARGAGISCTTDSQCTGSGGQCVAGSCWNSNVLVASELGSGNATECTLGPGGGCGGMFEVAFGSVPQSQAQTEGGQQMFPLGGTFYGMLTPYATADTSDPNNKHGLPPQQKALANPDCTEAAGEFRCCGGCTHIGGFVSQFRFANGEN